MSEGCAELWGAVFARAIEDACHVKTVRMGSGETSGAPTRRDVHEAWKFLTDTSGEWAGMREKLATLNGVNPEAIREHALKLGLSRAAWMAIYSVAKPKPKTRKKRRPEFRKADRAEQAVRNKAMLKEYGAGVPMAELVERYKLHANSISQIANRRGVYRPTEMRDQLAQKARETRNAQFAARNNEIIERLNAGERIKDVAQAFGMTRRAVDSLLRRKRVAATNASGECSGEPALVAAGGGGVGASFHVHNMEDLRQ